ELVHQRTIELQQHPLTDNIRVVTQDTGFVVACVQMQQVHQWPGEVVVDDVMLPDQLPEAAEHLPGQSGRRQIDIEFCLVNLVVAHSDRMRRWFCTEGQHAASHTPWEAGLAQLENGLFDAAHGVGQVGLEKVQYSHQQLPTAL